VSETPGRYSHLASSLRRDIHMATVALTPQLVDFRRELHRHPELGRHEHATTDRLAQALEDAGLTPKRLPGTGLTCDFGPEDSGRPRVAIRSDIDALPVPEATGLPFASENEGVAHACGHDVHMTCVFGAGLVLKQLADRGQLPAPVRLIFQPAEELLPSGAPDVIAAGALDGVGRIVAMHCDPHYDVGQVATRPGPITSACDLITVYAYGDGGHTSRPHLTQDLVFVTGQLLVQVPAVISHLLDPRAGANLTWGAVHAGEAHNVIPNSAAIRGTLRVLDARAWEHAGEVLRDAVVSIAEPYGVRTELDHKRGVPPVVNDPVVAQIMSTAGRAVLGESGVLVAEQSLGGEDFAWYLHHVPGALMRLGTRTPGGRTYDIHQGDFTADERAIPVGVEVFAATAVMAG
jgi:amidohydrolase